VKAQLADPRLHDLESTEERASDALQRAQAKPHKLEQAQKVVRRKIHVRGLQR